MHDYRVRQAYFGKIPCRGDFIRSAQLPELTQTLDAWLTGAMQQLAADPHWKTVYDQMPSIDFLIAGSNSDHVLPGIMLGTSDASGRRFPFVRVGVFNRSEHTHELVSLVPACANFWRQLRDETDALLTRQDAETALHGLEQDLLTPSFDVLQQQAQSQWQTFLGQTTLADLQARLPGGDVRQVIMAAGILLQPLLTADIAILHKGICFPLPEEGRWLPMFAAVWLSLVDVFLRRQAYEATLFVLRSPGTAELLLVFSSGDAHALSSVMDVRSRAEFFVDLARSEWVEEQIGGDYGFRKLSNYLLQPQLSVQQALRSFREIFVG